MGLDDARKPTSRFAWPGGYPIYAVMDDGALLCHECLQEDEVHEGGDADGWRFETAEIFWEGPAEHCGHCGTLLDSAYGDPDEDV